MERGAAPARMPRKHSSGTPRVAVRSNYVGLPSMAGRARTKGGESCLAREGEESSVQWPEVRPRGAKSPQIAHAGASLCACGAPQGVCPSPRARHASAYRWRNCVHLFAHDVDCWCASRRSTSLGLSEGKEKGDGAPAPQTIGRAELFLLPLSPCGRGWIAEQSEGEPGEGSGDSTNAVLLTPHPLRR
ncbi:MAG: hypothetical protein QOD40_1159 [Alphaproteobacteria bacterium]|jgi:hypothetical protein|nr:hypothetical protein [Alphaproteobacteria bacterium]